MQVGDRLEILVICVQMEAYQKLQWNVSRWENNKNSYYIFLCYTQLYHFLNNQGAIHLPQYVRRSDEYFGRIYYPLHIQRSLKDLLKISKPSTKGIAAFWRPSYNSRGLSYHFKGCAISPRVPYKSWGNVIWWFSCWLFYQQLINRGQQLNYI